MAVRVMGATGRMRVSWFDTAASRWRKSNGRDRASRPAAPVATTDAPGPSATAASGPGRLHSQHLEIRAALLVGSPHRLKPGARTELRLLGPARCIVCGRIDRCRVIRHRPDDVTRQRSFSSSRLRGARTG